MQLNTAFIAKIFYLFIFHPVSSSELLSISLTRGTKAIVFGQEKEYG